MDTGYPPDSGFDLAVRRSLPGGTSDQARAAEPGEGEAVPLEDRLLRLAQAADRQSVSFAQQTYHTQWRNNYKQFRSEYTDNSKYKSADYRHRSKIFRPKTRIAITKDMASAMESLFSTTDAVTVSASDKTDPKQVANAEVQRALLNYRLDRTSGSNAIPWFLVAMGARQDCQIMSICCSKQFWRYEYRTRTEQDPETGESVERKVKVRDKPEIELIPGENIGMDPAASWLDPVNSAAYFSVRYPMHLQDVKDMLADPRGAWKATDLGEDDIKQARVKDFERATVRQAREGGKDRHDNQTSTEAEFDVVWVVEWFIRTEDEDWNFWTLGTAKMLSDPVATEEAYPWKGGERPYRIGYGNLEAHTVVSQAPVETWSPLQLEINDITNLTLDTIKQVIQPVAKVVRGKKIDTEALKRRYPVLFVEKAEDVEWDRPPESAVAAFTGLSRLDTDFDDLAGVFSGGSVAANRQVGETVGGMKLMSGSSGATTRFFLKLWIETWVEPVLSDLARLEAYYESDEKILALARKRAPAMEKYGINEITDEFLNQEVMVSVSAGSGDQQLRMAKLGQAIELTAKMVQGSKRFQTGEITLNEKALIDEIWGNADVKDAFERFFEVGEPMPQAGAEGQAAGKSPEELAAESADKAADRQSKEKIARLDAKTDIVKALIQHRGDLHGQARDHQHDMKKTVVELIADALREAGQARERAQDREIAQRQSAQKKPQQQSAA